MVNSGNQLVSASHGLLQDMYIYIYIYIYIHMFIHVHVCIYLCMYAYLYMYIYECISICYNMISSKCHTFGVVFKGHVSFILRLYQHVH